VSGPASGLGQRGALLLPAPPWVDNRTERQRDADWSARADRYRRRVPYCELCERRTDLQVHHCYGHDVVSPYGHESDDELMTLCSGTSGIYKPKVFRKAKDDRLWFARPRCHNRITNAHRALGRQRGEVVGTRTVKPRAYSATIAEVTAAARPRYWARGWRRTFLGLPSRREP
jgi:hypothetical protein